MYKHFSNEHEFEQIFKMNQERLYEFFTDEDNETINKVFCDYWSFLNMILMNDYSLCNLFCILADPQDIKIF